MRTKLNVALSVDVEEEGLFRGRYQCHNVTVSNISSLSKLSPLFDRGVKPTFFCAFHAFTDSQARKVLERMRLYGEIGAHLHHWNTPPVVQNIPASGILTAVPARQIPLQCMDAKLSHLIRECNSFLGSPVESFRMGRWDLHRSILPLLVKYGIKTDASVRPLHCFTNKDNGPDHFEAPSEPYWIDIEGNYLLEVPLTVTPILAPLAYLPGKFSWGRKIRASLRHWGALAILPVEHPLWLMKLATNLHINSGGRTLSIAWHSTDLMLGGNPRLPNMASVDKFIKKISHFLDWLESNFEISYATMSQLHDRIKPHAVRSVRAADWTWHKEECDAAN